MARHPLLGEDSPTKIDYRKKDTLILATLLEDLVLPLLFVQEPRNDYDHFKVMCLYSLGP